MKSTTCCENALPVITDVITKACRYAFHPHTLYMQRMLQYLFMKNLEFGHYCWSATSVFDISQSARGRPTHKKTAPDKVRCGFLFLQKSFRLCRAVFDM